MLNIINILIAGMIEYDLSYLYYIPGVRKAYKNKYTGALMDPLKIQPCFNENINSYEE
jgi:hypothetical protein